MRECYDGSMTQRRGRRGGLRDMRRNVSIAEAGILDLKVYDRNSYRSTSACIHQMVILEAIHKIHVELSR